MLKKIREKPDHIKHTLAIAITTVIFSCIVFIWWSSKDARSMDVLVREKTVSPIDGVASMFDGFATSLKERVENITTGEDKSMPTSTPTDIFDLSSVVIIDTPSTTIPVN